MKTMRDIAQSVREGAMAYLRQQYKVVGIVFVVLCLIFIFMAFVLDAQNKVVPFAFLTGGFFSGLCGFLGMKTATKRLRTHDKCCHARTQCWLKGIVSSWRSHGVDSCRVRTP